MPDIVHVEPNPEANIKPLPSMGSDHAAVKELVDTISQNFGEMVRSQKATAEYHGVKLSEQSEAVETINKGLEAAATEIASMDAKIKRYEAAAVERDTAAKGDAADPRDFRNSEDHHTALLSYITNGGDSLTDDERRVLAQGNAYHAVIEKTKPAAKRKKDWDPVNAVSAGGLSTTFGPGAGVWARPEYDSEVTRLIVEHSPIRQWARVTPIGGPEFVGTIRTSDRDTIEQVGEVGTSAGATQQVQKNRYIERRIRPFIYYARPGLTEEMIEDSLIDLEGEVTGDVALDFAVDEASNFTTGGGGNAPEGYATDATNGNVTGITSETSGAISQKDLLRLALDLRPPYRGAPKVAYSFSTTAFRDAILHEDGLGRRLWEPSHQERGLPSLYQGWPYFEATEQAAVAAGSLSVFFAAWPQFYRIIDRVGLKITRDETSTIGLVILNFRRRYGGRTWKTEAGRVLTTKT